MNKKFVFVNLSIESDWNTGVNHGITFLTPIARRTKGEEWGNENLLD